MDLEEASEIVNREELWKELEEYEVERYLVNCLKKLYKVSVRVGVE